MLLFLRDPFILDARSLRGDVDLYERFDFPLRNVTQARTSTWAESYRKWDDFDSPDVRPFTADGRLFSVSERTHFTELDPRTLAPVAETSLAVEGYFEAAAVRGEWLWVKTPDGLARARLGEADSPVTLTTVALPPTDRESLPCFDSIQVGRSLFCSRLEPPPVESRCTNECEVHASNGSCDDGGSFNANDYCDLGDDCDDCGVREFRVACFDTCDSAGDGECRDGGWDTSLSVWCDLGTDCADCGARRIHAERIFPEEGYVRRIYEVDLDTEAVTLRLERPHEDGWFRLLRVDGDRFVVFRRMLNDDLQPIGPAEIIAVEGQAPPEVLLTTFVRGPASADPPNGPQPAIADVADSLVVLWDGRHDWFELWDLDGGAELLFAAERVPDRLQVLRVP